MQLQFTTDTLSDIALWQSPLLPARFWAKVNLDGPVPPHCPVLGQCWVWTAACNRQGYGRFGVGSLTEGTRGHVLAHRHTYAVLIGPISADLRVLHHCDNPPCIRPSHLFLGTQVENMGDMARKGRAACGERNGSAKLTEAKVLEIRLLAREGMTQRAIARQFGVTFQTVSRLIRRELWAHV